VINSPSEAGTAQPSVSGFSGIRRPWLILSLVLVASAVALKYGAGGDRFELTPTELSVSTAGFLANKVAVLLAAFKPMQSNSKTEDGSGN
jgi:cytosine/uracil/thiamine/allantoin permease